MEGNCYNSKTNNSTYFLLLGALESDDNDEVPLASLVGKPVEISKEIAQHLLETFAGSGKKEIVPEPPSNRIKKSNTNHTVTFSPSVKVIPSSPPSRKYDDYPERNSNQENSTNSLLEELVQTSIPVPGETQENCNSQIESEEIEDYSFHHCRHKKLSDNDDDGDIVRNSGCSSEIQNHDNDYATCSSSKNFRHSDSKTTLDSNLAKRKSSNEKRFENVGACPKKKSCLFRKHENSMKNIIRIQDSYDSDTEDLDGGKGVNSVVSCHNTEESSSDCENVSRQWNKECRCSECRAKFN